MTATIDETQTTTDEFPEFDFETQPAIPCDGISWSYPCDEEAKFKNQRKCCGGIVLLCEDCLLTMMQFLREHTGEMGKCAACNKVQTISVGNIIFLGRIK